MGYKVVKALKEALTGFYGLFGLNSVPTEPGAEDTEPAITPLVEPLLYCELSDGTAESGPYHDRNHKKLLLDAVLEVLLGTTPTEEQAAQLLCDILQHRTMSHTVRAAAVSQVCFLLVHSCCIFKGPYMASIVHGSQFH